MTEIELTVEPIDSKEPSNEHLRRIICAVGLLFIVCTVKIRSLTNNITNELIINVYHKCISLAIRRKRSIYNI